MTATINYPSIQKILIARDIVANKKPLTPPFKDSDGKVIQIWKAHSFLFGTVHCPDGTIHIISQEKIINALDNKSLSSLSHLSFSIEKRWRLTFVQEKITLWPPLVAGMVPYFHPGKTPHIFDGHKTIRGHFPLDNAENRQKILDVAKDPNNCVGKDKFGNTIYMKTFRNGDQIWVEVRANGMINNGGKNYLPKKWVADPQNPRGGSYEDVLAITHQPSDFRERVQTNNLVDSYNSSHPDAPMPEGKATGGHIGGVANAVGIIKNLFDTIEERSETEHFFYLPSVKGKLSLSKKEIDQLLHELAVGIFVHDTVPFFSLHFNGDTNMYPVIHPTYQNTFVGHVIALLDYYMKGFVNGGFFKSDFVLEWNQRRTTDESVLKRNLVDVFDYTKPFLKPEETYYSIKEALQMLKLSGKIKNDPKEPPILQDFSGFRSSFRIIAKQDSIKKTENLFIIDGDFDVLYTISPDPIYEKELEQYKQEHGKNPPSYEALEIAYNIMCQQIKQYMPRLPEFKKMFEALNLINFFCYYYNTLKNEDKFPLIEQTYENNHLKCPPLFPHLPLREFYYNELKLTLDDILNTLSPQEKNQLAQALQDGRHSREAIHLIVRAMITKVRGITGVSLSQKHFEPATYQERAERLFNRLKELYKTLYKELKERADQKALEGLRELAQREREFNTTYQEKVNEWEQNRRHYDDLTSGFLSSFNPNYQTFLSNKRVCEGNLEGFRTQKTTFDAEINKWRKTYKEWQDNPITFLEDPSSFPFGVIKFEWPLEIRDTFLRLYSEQTNEEKILQKRVVGGCGVHLENKPSEVAPLAYPMLDHLHGRLVKLAPNKMLSLEEQSEEIPPGAFFKMSFTNQPNGNEEGKKTALAYLSPPSFQMSRSIEDLLYAIKSNNETLFFEAAKNIAQFDFRDQNGITPLHLAVIFGSHKMVSFLLGKISPRSPDSLGYTPLHYAAMEGSLSSITTLLNQAPGLVEEAPPGGGTPLHTAVQNGQKAAVVELLKKGANPNSKTAQGLTPLISALYEGHEEIALILINDSRTDVNIALDDKTTAIHIAAQTGNEKITQALIARGAQINQVNWSGFAPLHLSVEKGHLKVVSLLLNAPGNNPNILLKNGKTALHLAAANDFFEIVELLLSKSADPCLVGWDKETPLVTATKNGAINSSLCLYNALKNRTIQINQNTFVPALHFKNVSGWNAIKVAATFKIYDLWFHFFNPLTDNVVETQLTPKEHLILLCKAEIDPDIICSFIKKYSLEYLIHEAYQISLKHNRKALSSSLKKQFKVAEETNSAQNQKEELKVKLLQRDVDRVDALILQLGSANFPLTKNGSYPVHIAVINNDLPMIDLLIKRGAKFDVVDENQRTPFDLCVIYKRPKILETLLNPLLELPIPQNLLHTAAAEGDEESLRMVFKRISDLEIEDDSHQTPLNLAVGKEKIKNVLFLLSKGALRKGQGPHSTLRLAAKSHSPILLILLKFHPLKTPEEGYEALVEATLRGIEKNVEILLQEGCDPHFRVGVESSAYNLAKRDRLHSIVALFENNKGQIDKLKRECMEALQNEEIEKFFLKSSTLSHDFPILFPISHKGESLQPITHLLYLKLHDPALRLMALKNYIGQHPKAITLLDSDGDNLLHIVGLRDHKIKFTDLPFKSSQIEEGNNNNVTPLHLFGAEGTLEDLNNLLFTHDNKLRVKPNAFNKEDNKGETPLFYAVRKNRLENIEFLVKNKADVNHRSHELMTLVGIAIDNNSLPMLRLLLSHGAHIEDRIGLEHESALHVSIKKKHDEITFFLFSQGVDVTCKDQNGVQPIHLAAAQGKRNLVRLLIACGADPLAQDNEGKTVMHYAAESSSKELIDDLKNSGASIEPDSFETTPGQVALKNGNIPMVAEFALQGAKFQGSDPEKPNGIYQATLSRNKKLLKLMVSSPLIKHNETITRSIRAALQIDSVDQLEILLSQMSSVNLRLNPHTGETLLHIAASHGAIRSLRFLIGKGGDLKMVTTQGLTPFDYALLTGELNVAYAISKEIEIDLKKKLHDGSSYFHVASNQANRAMIAFLATISSSMKETITALNAPDSSGNTPLHLSAKLGDRQSAQLLILLGANPSLKNNDQQTAFDLVQSAEMKRMMLNFSTTLNSEVIKGAQPIHVATLLEDLEGVTLLGQIGEINAQDREGRTPLHLASQKNNLKLLRKIRTLSSSLEIKDNKGYTPLVVAALENERVDALNDLIKAGSNPSQIIDKTSLLEMVFKQGSSKKAHFQMLYNAIPAIGNDTTLQRGVQNGNSDLMFDALNKGAKIGIKEVLTAIKAKQKNLAITIISWFDLELGDDALSTQIREALRELGDYPFLDKVITGMKRKFE